MNSSTFSQVNEGAPSAQDAGVFSAADGVIFGVIFALICVVVWLADREIKISRIRLRDSEELLESEKYSLERRIAERTVEYVRAEQERMIELQKNAEFGKLSQGLFHDLISPLSSVSLYAQQLEKDSNRSGSYSEKEKEMIRTVIESSKRMNLYMESVRKSLQSEATDRVGSSLKLSADLQKEIDVILDILGYKARMSGVEIAVKFDHKYAIILPIDPVRLQQLILNLVSNAIDACTNFPISEGRTEHLVTISVNKIDGNHTLGRSSSEFIELSVSDTGSGISSENQKRLFSQSFTTKKDGSGIGLMTVKMVVERDLGGSINVESEEGKGAKFVVKIPYIKTK